MEPNMKLDPSSVRRLREAKNWSQEQLAKASGVSLRTIQRVETEGTASRETRVCLAAALDVEVTLISEIRNETGQVRTPDAWRVSSVAFMLVGVAMLMSALLSSAPNIIYYIAAFFLFFGVFEYAYKSIPTNKA